MKKIALALCVAMFASVGVASAQSTTVDLALPDIVDWTQVITVIVATLGAGLLAVMGTILGFRVVKKLLGKLGGAA